MEKPAKDLKRVGHSDVIRAATATLVAAYEYYDEMLDQSTALVALVETTSVLFTLVKRYAKQERE